MDHEMPPDTSEQEPPAEPPKVWPEPTEREIDEAEQSERAQEVYERERRTQDLIDSTQRMLAISEEIAARRDAESVGDEPDDSSLQDIIDKNISPGKKVQVKLLVESWNQKLADVHRAVEQSQTNFETEIRKHFGKYRPVTNESGEVIGIEEPAKARKASAVHDPKHTKSTTLKRTGKPTHYLSPRDKGAPSRIAREIRGDL